MNNRKPIESWAEVPKFRNEDEEAEFWEHHSFGEGVLEDGRSGHPPHIRQLLAKKKIDPVKRRALISALGLETARRLERVGAFREKEPSEIAREFILRCLEEEEHKAGIPEN